MSWIGGEFIINDMKEKTLKEVYSSISSAVRHNADLEEFPYMGTDIMKIKPFHKGKIYDSQEEASKALSESYKNFKYSKFTLLVIWKIFQRLLT